MLKQFVFSLSIATALTLASTPNAFAKDAQSEANDAAMAQALAALDAQLPGKLINNPYTIQWKTEGSDKRESIVESEGVPGGMAYRVRIKKTKRKAWDTATRIPMTTSIAKDDVIMVSFWARAAKLAKGKEVGDIMASLQRNVEPYDDILQEDIEPTSEWKLYSLSGTAKRDFAADKTNMNFNLARAKQTIEFGPFYVMNLGPGADASQFMK